eukprot:scaffold164689_cov45-Prasinocladus_malaysianus.AAC.2
MTCNIYLSNGHLAGNHANMAEHNSTLKDSGKLVPKEDGDIQPIWEFPQTLPNSADQWTLMLNGQSPWAKDRLHIPMEKANPFN